MDLGVHTELAPDICPVFKPRGPFHQANRLGVGLSLQRVYMWGLSFVFDIVYAGYAAFLGSASQFFLSSLRSIMWAGMQYTGSRSMSPG